MLVEVKGGCTLTNSRGVNMNQHIRDTLLANVWLIKNGLKKDIVKNSAKSEGYVIALYDSGLLQQHLLDEELFIINTATQQAIRA
jgi:hypothetical protein